ncbi:MAG: N-formylglutamate amidohydrolase [Myxococcota bacterium]
MVHTSERIAARPASERTPFFAVDEPTARPTPVLVEIPHAGLAVPDGVELGLAASRQAILRDADVYVDKLLAGAEDTGATVLRARVSRYVVDLNRAPDDVDRETVTDHPSPRTIQPRGVVWRVTTDGKPSLARPLRYVELQERLNRFYFPYHRRLQEELQRLARQFGHVVLLASHSMPSMGRGNGSRRADVVPGTRGRTTASSRVIDLVDRHFRDAGLSVRHDEPYRGGFTTGHYGRPAHGWHAVQIELNRSLYVHESTGEPKPAEMEELRRIMVSLAGRLAEIEP